MVTPYAGVWIEISPLAMYDIWIDLDESGVTRVDKDDVNAFYRSDKPTLLANDKYDIWIGDE